MTASDLSLAALPRLAVEDPREARAFVARLLDTDVEGLADLIMLASAPDQSRLRQLIANAVRSSPARREAVPQLEEWLKSETDEFTKKALRSAITAIPALDRASQARDPHPVDREYVEAYRYAADRLTHRIRNALAEPQAILMRLGRAISAAAPDSRELDHLATALARSLTAVSRIAEFESGDEHFALRAVHVVDWIVAMNHAYAKKYTRIDLSFQGEANVERWRVLASDYLLETVFWNLWVNAQQAVSDDCRIVVLVAVARSSVQLTLVDNGPGFTGEARELALSARYSTKGAARGRGLLEVQDALERLRGDIEFVEIEDRSTRLRITLPGRALP